MRPLVRHEKAFNLIGIALFPIKTSTTVHKIRSKFFEGSSGRTPGVLCVLKMHHAFFLKKNGGPPQRHFATVYVIERGGCFLCN